MIGKFGNQLMYLNKQGKRNFKGFLHHVNKVDTKECLKLRVKKTDKNIEIKGS